MPTSRDDLIDTMTSYCFWIINKQLLKTQVSFIICLHSKFTRKAFPFCTSQIHGNNNAYPTLFSSLYLFSTRILHRPHSFASQTDHVLFVWPLWCNLIIHFKTQFGIFFKQQTRHAGQISLPATIASAYIRIGLAMVTMIVGTILMR